MPDAARKPTLAVEERIRLHLLDYQRFRESFVVPPELTQAGIAQATGVLRPNVSRSFQELMAKGLAEERLAHVSGQSRRKKVYFLTVEGQRATQAARDRLLALPVRAKGPDGKARDATLGTVLEGEEDATLLALYDRLDELGNVLDVRAAPSDAALLYNRMAESLREGGPAGRAQILHEAALAFFRERGERLMVAKALNNLGVVHRLAGRPERARDCYREAVDILERAGDVRGAALIRYNMGRLAEEGGDGKGAREMFERAWRDLSAHGTPDEAAMADEARKRAMAGR